MIPRSLLVVSALFYALASTGQLVQHAPQAERAFDRALRACLTPEKAASQDPTEVTGLEYWNYSDSVFPPPEVLHYPNLQTLAIHGRAMRTRRKDPSQPTVHFRIDLPALQQLTHLKHVAFAYVDFSAFPEELTGLDALESLILANCLIDSIPASIGALHQLKLLDLSRNYIADLPTDMAGMDSLQVLHLPNNHLRHFPGVLVRMPVLEFVDLSDPWTGHTKDGSEREYEKQGISWPYPLCANHIDVITEADTVLALLRNVRFDQLLVAGRACGDKRSLEHLSADPIALRKIRFQKPSPCPDARPFPWIVAREPTATDRTPQRKCTCEALSY